MKTVQPLTRFSAIIVRTGIWGLTTIVLLMCLLFARLFFAPINLDFARENILDQAETILPGWHVSYASADIGWDWRSVRPWLAIKDIRLVDRRQRLTADVPEIRIGTSFSQILTGVRVSTVEIDRANIKLLDIGGFSDDTDGSVFDDLFVNGSIPKPEVLKPVTEAFSRFGRRLMQRAPALDSIILNDSVVEINRGATYGALPISIKNLALDRNDRTLGLTSQLDVTFAQTPTRLRLIGSTEPDFGEVSVSVAFSELTPADLLSIPGAPGFLSYIEVPFGLELTLEMGADVGLRSAGYEIVLSDGYLTNEISYPVPAPIRYGVITGSYSVAEDTFSLDQVEIGIENSVVRGDGLLFWEDGVETPGMRVNLEIDETDVAEVLKYWPIKTFPDGRHRGARAWVSQHMLKGTVRNTKFQYIVETDGSSPFEDDSSLLLTFDFEDLDTHFVKTMKPLRDARGRSVLSENKFEVFVSEANVEGLAVDGSRAVLSNINVKNGSHGNFNINMRGPVGEILTVLDDHPVSISKKMGIGLDRLAGDANVQALLSLPLYKKVGGGLDVEYDINADITGAVVKDILNGEGVKEATMALRLTPDELQADGSGLLNDVAVDFHWTENFAAGRLDPVADTTNIVLTGMVGEQELAQLGVDVSEYLEGKTVAEATFLGRNFNFRMGYFSADAAQAALKLDVLGYRKEPNYAANLNGLIFFNGEEVKISPLSVKGEDIDLTAEIDILGRADQFTVKAKAEQLGRNKGLVAEVFKDASNDISATLTADTLDIAPLISEQEKPAEVTPKQSTAQVVSQGSGLNYNLDVTAADLLLLNGAKYKNIEAGISFKNDEPEAMDIKGEGIEITVAPDEVNGRDLNIETNNAGEFLRGIGVLSQLHRGDMTLTAKMSGWGSRLHLQDALMKASATKLVATSQLNDEVKTGTISGLDEYLESGAIDLDVIDLPFELENNLLDISNMKANGPTFGMTMEGQIDANSGKININGVIVPAYGINSLLGKIPLLGGLFSGGEGKGLFGVTYRVKGLTDDPEVNISRLSGIAPGFLRLLFEGKKGKVADVEEEAPKPEPTAADNPEAISENVPKEKGPA
ncbi:AsmA-like C-terminal domain-containing protein [Kordiimonas sp. SCSIO 12603]|uniref:YhdP family protein n=1 Tax=Kordiimonas sp. SCSIO 12603 TaxID=2829596 RepID=UPI002106DD31|nr:AsmA-like C-terminal domain-containing protein [Kordiimonas sp. SCSIO 12603]UTW57327.1 AsmA-like C-terminal domain-containing protein [Kordiimonas sp. SCSIO 12603]